MHLSLDIHTLLDYTEWERQKWLQWIEQQGPEEVLHLSTGPHGDGRFEGAGEVIRHIFSAEKRYIERLQQQPVTDATHIPADSLQALFQLGQQSRRELRSFIQQLPPEQWDTPRTFTLMNSPLTATPRKLVTHVLLHEIRHWAQLATVFRWNGRKVDPHDILFSPVMGEEFKLQPQTT